MQYYMKWEGTDIGSGDFRTGTLEIDERKDLSTDELRDLIRQRLRARNVKWVWGGYIDRAEYTLIKRAASKSSTSRRRGFVLFGGIAGCSAAAILLPLPVAIWAASAFAALTATAAVPP